MLIRGGFEDSSYITNNLKYIFWDKIKRESARFDPKKEKIISQKLIPVERFDPQKGKEEVVDVKVINYVVTKDGKIQVVFEGEPVPSKVGKEKEEKKTEKLDPKDKNKDIDKMGEKKSQKDKDISIEKEKAMTYMCSNGETNDGLITKLTPTESLIHVSFHEQQHLIARNIEAFLNDEKIFLQYIRLFTRIDPTTGKIYVAGGRAITIKGKVIHPRSLFQGPLQHPQAHTYQAPS